LLSENKSIDFQNLPPEKQQQHAASMVPAGISRRAEREPFCALDIFSGPHGWCAMFLFVPKEITAGGKRGRKPNDKNDWMN